MSRYSGTSEVEWTAELIAQKYTSYVQGYTLEKGKAKKILAYIIYLKANPIGYIQLYNAHDFESSRPLEGLPRLLGAFDMFIEQDALGKGIGAQALLLF